MVNDSERGNPLPHVGYSFRLAARVILYTSPHKQDNTYHILCYTSRGALAGIGEHYINGLRPDSSIKQK